jgi:hypothetical protein
MTSACLALVFLAAFVSLASSSRTALALLLPALAVVFSACSGSTASLTSGN